MAKSTKVLSTKSDEFVLEKFFDDYIVPWFQERVINAVTYGKAREEIDLLRKRGGKQKKISTESTDEEKRSVQRLPDKPSNVNSRKPTGRPVSANKTPKPKAQGGPNEARKQASTRAEVDLQHLLLENANYKKKLSEMEEEMCEIKAQADIDLRKKDQQLEKLRTALENAKAQVDELTMRLSKLAGDKLRAGNPDLADLSDAYRPTELGKMFSEIYDNEWSDAFENVLKTEAEERRVGLLHGIVKKAFSFCEGKFRYQVQFIRAILLAEDQSDENKRDSPALKTEMKTTRTANIHNLLKDIRKQMAPQTAENVAKKFVEVELKQFAHPFGIKDKNLNDSLKKYAFKCAEISWFMMVCDPQMALSEDKRDTPFDLNVYKPYTKSTKNLKKPVVELPVWPALHLHDGGPLVAKGVAQPGERDLAK